MQIRNQKRLIPNDCEPTTFSKSLSVESIYEMGIKGEKPKPTIQMSLLDSPNGKGVKNRIPCSQGLEPINLG